MQVITWRLVTSNVLSGMFNSLAVKLL